MELKEYQQKSLDQVRQYLETLNNWRRISDLASKEAHVKGVVNFPQQAWEKIVKTPYRSRKDGVGEYLPNFCLKIPTGGGKTLLAVKVIDLINTQYRQKQTGLVLWVVPTTQIYNQTLGQLRNREHPYRQHLDVATGGRTIILEKTDRFTPLDIKDNLVVLLLMLPSANRVVKETLKIFKDSGGFQSFFPPEDDIEGHKKLLSLFPNLDAFGKDSGFFGRQIKTSLGNTLRILNPVIILDEGHKAYSEGAQKTLWGFNPSLIVELSATPQDESNILVDIKGAELNREGMIKLDLHVTNKSSTNWKDTLLASAEKRNALEEKAKEYQANSGEYIRPICLIQAERTGKDQRGNKFIHAEDVAEYLQKTAGIPKEHIAIKSSEKDDIEGLDLFSPSCPIRYIITKQALQEGWDCSFAYVLTILTNPTSKNNLTQLVGRILRQPFARKTGAKELDESYVFCFQQRGADLMKVIKKGFESEGLGDLTTQIIHDGAEESASPEEGEKTVSLRKEFKKFAGQILLPVFVIKDGHSWRRVSYEADIISQIDWENADFSSLKNLPLEARTDTDTEFSVGLSADKGQVIEQHGLHRLANGGLALDTVFIARHLLEGIPNPWLAYEIAQEASKSLVARHGIVKVANELVFVIEELRKKAESEKDRLAHEIFVQMLKDNKMRFMIVRGGNGYTMRDKLKVKRSSRTLTRHDEQPLQYSLFDFVPEEQFNETEKSVAWYLEEQEKLLWWYRNISREDYAIQGWRKHKVYPDFIFSEISKKDRAEFDKVFVVETKGLHLKDNDDTKYKTKLFEYCNKLAKERSLTDIGLSLKERTVSFEIISDDEWQVKVRELLKGEGQVATPLSK